MLFTELNWTLNSPYPVLITLQLLPLAGAILILAMKDSAWLKQIALLVAGAEMLLVIDMFTRYDHSTATMQLAERLELFGPFAYHAAVDGISIVFMLLTALMVLLVAIYGISRGLKPASRFFSVLLGIESSLMAMFTTMNLMWFIVLSTVQLGLVGYMLWRWAQSPEKDFALTRFYQFMGLGILLLLAGTLALGWNAAHETGQWSFDLFVLAQVPMLVGFQSVVFFLLFYGFSIRTPFFPLHGWLPLIAEHGNIAIAPALFLGIKIGIYALLRFVFPLVPDAIIQWHNYVVGFAVVGIFYAALLAMLQINLRRLIAFAVISHTGIIIMGLFSLHHLAFQGAVLLSITFGLAAAALSLVTGMIYRRTRTTRLDKLGGLFDHIPLLGITFFIAGLSIIGMPGTPGFDAVHLVLEASIARFGGLLTIAAALGNVLAAGFLLWAFQRAFLGSMPGQGESSMTIEKARPSELLVAGLIVAVLLSTGFHITPLMELIEMPLDAISHLYPGE